MANGSRVLTKKKALRIVLIIALALLCIIVLRSCRKSSDDLSTLEGRQHFLQTLGWEIDPDTEDHKSVMLPDNLDGVLADYNRIQTEQGYDLNKHLGERCEQYSYQVTNYPDADQTVLVTLYIQGKQIIAGDIHSTELNGFMQGLENK